jgi:hypothetical protein
MPRIAIAMTDDRKFSRAVAAALLAALLAGCTTTASQDDQVGRLLVAPDKFMLYNCSELPLRWKALSDREKELQGLMVKAGTSPDGRLVSELAYRPEYLAVRGEMNELRNAATAKNCKYVPGADNPGGRASDSAVR